MTVEVTLEDEALLSWGIVEDCCKCYKPTRYWHKNDVALCPGCAEKVEEKDVPTKKKWIQAVTRRNKRLGIEDE